MSAFQGNNSSFILSEMKNKNKQKKAENQPQSPQKIIVAKGRSLALLKCMVNQNWTISKMANVLVIRQHASGKVTVGVYLVDLMCLGVKDTFFIFNEEPGQVEDEFESQNIVFKEIAYPLAHNIIFAGHDFAAEFDINPHPQFNITKYLLEEDDDNVPLIEISVGNEEGKPQIIAEHAVQYADALSKLKKHAGEGNYNYIVMEE